MKAKKTGKLTKQLPENSNGESYLSPYTRQLITSCLNVGLDLQHTIAGVFYRNILIALTRRRTGKQVDNAITKCFTLFTKPVIERGDK